MDRSDASARALQEARELCADAGCRLSIVHVAPSPLLLVGDYAAAMPDPGDLAAAAREWLREVVTDTPGTEGVLLEGYPPQAVVAWAETAKPDLLVAAAHRGLVDRVLLGSFAGYLAHHAPCPVLLVRPPAGEE
jgi:nucleotide-binding universal stress UspA family protein